MSQSSSPEANRSYYFGTFKLDSERRELLQDGQPLHLRAREFDILLFLVENAGQFVTKDQLTERVWPTTTVSDANIRVQIAALRRVLGDGRDNARYILSAAGRGYSFCCPLESPDTAVAHGRQARSAAPVEMRYNLPVRLKPTLGRGEAANRLISHLPHHRLVSIVGAGGIGKTTLALTVAESLIDAYDDGIRFVDLAGLSDPDLLASTMAATLEPMKSSDVAEEMIRHLGDKQLLFILDNCEHVIEAAATLVERVLTRTRDIHFLATSREPLRIDGEWLFRLGPLDVPPRKADLTAAEALAYPTVRLFVERARLNDSRFELVDDDAVSVAELCRRLDGNPLAVELAAARVGLFGIPGLAAQLEENFGMLSQGRRTALPRHQTLRATLDWSYEILSADEQALLRRLSVFRGEFTLATARAVAAVDAGFDILEALAELTAKSLLNVDVSHQPARYRMLFLTRDYARQKLKDSGEFDLISRRHAKAYIDLLTAKDPTAQDSDAPSWIEDIRAAIDWAFSETGDALIGMQLTRSSVDLGAKLSLMPEYGRRIDEALARLPELDPPQPLLELRLLIERINIVLHTVGDYAIMNRMSERALPIARQVFEQTGDSTGLYEVLALRFGLQFGQGQYPDMLNVAREAQDLFQPDASTNSINITAERMMAQASFFTGNHLDCLVHTRKIITLPDAMIKSRQYVAGDRNDPAVTMRIFQAINHWVLGAPEQASRMADEALSMSDPHALMSCYVLGMSVVPIAIWRGEIAAAWTAVETLSQLSEEFGLGNWARWARTYTDALRAIENDYAEGGEAADLFRTPQVEAVLQDMSATLHESLAGPQALDRVEAGYAAWNGPEVMRAHAERSLAAGRSTPEEAERLFQASLDMARRQNALSWQLRTVTSLARLWGYQRRLSEAEALLKETLARFTEGFGDSDFIAADALLKDLTQRAGAEFVK